MKKTLWIILLAIVFLSGCVTTVKQIYNPDGQLVYYISCPDNTLSECYQKAGEICGAKGYDISKLPGDNSYSLVIKCKP